MKQKLFFILLLGFVPALSFAQASAPASAPVKVQSSVIPPSAAMTPSAAPQSAVQVVGGAVDKIPSKAPAWMLAILAFVAELALRFYPTLKPKSLILWAGALLSLFGLGLTKISGLFDQIAQNLKEDPELPKV